MNRIGRRAIFAAALVGQLLAWPLARHRHADEAGIADHIEQEFHPWRHRLTSCSAIMPISLFEIMTAHAADPEESRADEATSKEARHSRRAQG